MSPSSHTRAPLNRPFIAAVATVLAFGVFMQLLLIMGIRTAEQTLDRGVAPMQELLLIQRQAAQALQSVKQQDNGVTIGCGRQTDQPLCETPLLLDNVAMSAQRLIDGAGGLAGLPRSRPLTGTSLSVALALRDRAQALRPLATSSLHQDAAGLLTLQRGLMEVGGLAHELEERVLEQLQSDYRRKHWLDILAVAGGGVLMAATVLVLFLMWSRVHQAFAEVQASRARLRAYTDAVPDTAFVLDRNGKVMEIMGRPQNRVDAPPTIPVGERLQDHRPPALVNQYMQTIRNAIEQQQVQTLETRLEDSQGQPRWYEARVAAIESRVGSPADSQHGPEEEAQVIWLTRDVTHRIHTEQELRRLNEELESRVDERTRELADAAEELRRFNYTVSHDLRAPLRAVEAYTALAVEEAGDALGDSARDLLERARKSAHQLAQMVESLLNLSRIGEMTLQHGVLDLSSMAQDICTAFGIDQKNHRIEWTVQADMSAWADEHLIRSLLQNLISNAVKYSAHRDPAVIDIGCETLDDGSAVFHVRDNGAGFDMARATQLFQPFTRLHSTREFEGDGIGLATVRRIVMRHGGRIWAQAQIDAGATIFFSLPGQPVRERDFSGSRPAPLE